MDIFLNFKNQEYGRKYTQDIDAYLSLVCRSNIIVALVVLPFFPLTQIKSFQGNTFPTSVNIERTVITVSIYTILLFVAFIIWRFRPWFRKHQELTRWIFDIFYNFVAGCLAYQYWETGLYSTDGFIRYFAGWWNTLTTVALFNSISKWYLKLSAYMIIILRIGISSYLNTGGINIIIVIVQVCILQILTTYLNERDQRGTFMKMQKLYDETKAFKDIFDETTDGVIIYGMKEGLIFRNWSNEKYQWWQNDQSLEEIFQKIALKGFKKASQIPTNIDLNLSSLVQGSNHANLWIFLEQLVEVLNSNLTQQSPTQRLQPGRLMVLTGHISQSSSGVQPPQTSTLEVKIMYVIFREKPALALIFSDITERNLVTVLQESDNYKNRLLASVSHELRTPLNASINFTMAAIDHPELANASEVREKHLLPALRSNQLLLHLINDIIDFSQMSTSKLKPVYENCNVVSTLDECINLVKLQAARKGLKISKEYQFDSKKIDFCTDHNRLKQIILNLLSNALKFTLKGEIQLIAKITKPQMFGERVLEVAVVDSGIGMSEKTLQRLEKAFQKAGNGDKLPFDSDGTGLGLIISNSLVLMLGPEQDHGIRIQSNLDQGSRFSFSIIDQAFTQELNQTVVQSEDLNSQMEEHPHEFERLETLSNLLPRRTIDTINMARERTTPAITFPLMTQTMNSQSFRHPQILIVDDDIFNISALEMILGKLNYSNDTAYNGAEAVQLVSERNLEAQMKRASQYKLIFMDCSMPIMDGFEASAILKNKMKTGEIDEIVIIACTAFISEKDRQRLNDIGVDGFCIKPLKPERIAEIVKKTMGIRH